MPVTERYLATYHNHTRYSDGKATIAEMVAAAEEAGIDELGISDHLTLAVRWKGDIYLSTAGELTPTGPPRRLAQALYSGRSIAGFWSKKL